MLVLIVGVSVLVLIVGVSVLVLIVGVSVLVLIVGVTVEEVEAVLALATLEEIDTQSIFTQMC